MADQKASKFDDFSFQRHLLQEQQRCQGARRTGSEHLDLFCLSNDPVWALNYVGLEILRFNSIETTVPVWGVTCI